MEQAWCGPSRARLQDISHDVIAHLSLKRVGGATDVERSFQVLLVSDSSQCIACASQGKENGHNNEAGGLDGERQPLYNTHEQVEATSGPVFVKVLDEVGERVRKWADAQEKWDLNKHHNEPLHDTDDGKHYDNRRMEYVGHA